MRLDVVLFSIVVGASMRLSLEDQNCLLALGSLSGEELEKEVKIMFFEGQEKMSSNEVSEFLELRELFSRRQMLNRAEQESLPGDVVIIAMLVTDGDVQMKYADSFEWDLEAEYGEELLKILMGEMKTNMIYASMQKATTASVIELAYNKAGSIIAYHCMGSRHWNIPGRWRRVFEIMLSIRAIKQEILYGDKYDKELQGVIKKAGFADLLCEYILESDDVANRNAEFMELRITSEILADNLYSSILCGIEMGSSRAFLSLAKKRGGSPERVLSDFIAEGYWLCSEGSRVDRLVRRLPRGHGVFRKICEKYPEEMRDTNRERLSIERLETMAINGELNKLVKNLVKRLVRCANVSGLKNLQNREPRARILFQELLRNRELNEDMKRGFKNVIRSREDAYAFMYFWNDLGVRAMSGELSRSGEFDEEVKRALNVAIKDANAEDLKWSLRNLPNAKSILKALLRTVPRARECARGLLSTEEFDEMTKESQEDD